MDEDKSAKGQVKQVNLGPEATPIQSEEMYDDLNDVAVQDPSLVGMDLSPYVTEGNRDCRVVRVGDVCVLALTKKPHVVTRHKALCNAFGTAVKAKCPLTACKRGFVDGVTMIAPVNIVGPISHGNLGGHIWVCEEHWVISAEDDEEDELSKVALKFEDNVFEKRGNLKREVVWPIDYPYGKRRKNLLQTCSTKLLRLWMKVMMNLRGEFLNECALI